MPKLQKLTIKNNWEAYQYFLGSQEVEPETIKIVEIRGKKYKTELDSYTVTYSDMGHNYDAYRKDLKIQMKTEFGKAPISLFEVQKFKILV